MTPSFKATLRYSRWADDTLKKIATELVSSVRQNATIDWNLEKSVRAALPTKPRCSLAKYDYQSGLEEKAVELVLEQADLFATDAHGDRGLVRRPESRQ